MEEKRRVAPSGILVVNKPSGMTSHDVVAVCRRLFGERRIGHAGTLDPMAEGVLVVLVGRASKASDYVMGHDKEYSCGFRLGIETDTEDITGTVTAEHGGIPDEAAVAAACMSFLGTIEQTHPMYSALKVNGRKLVDLARQGIEVERRSRTVDIKSVVVDPTDDPKEYRMTVRCSKGTYIRTLCADIGKKLGCGAVMTSLVRTESGPFVLKDAVTPDELAGMTYDERAGRLLPVESVFGEYPAVDMTDGEFVRLLNGMPLDASGAAAGAEDGALFRLRHGGMFIALGRRTTEDGKARIRQEKLFETGK